jgi:hypothetical protein
MKVTEIFEAKEETLLPVDSIAMMLFKQKAGEVKDTKRDKDKIYIGVSHEASTIKGSTGKVLHMTFDNSTDSGEFEIDSFTPLKIEKGSDIDKLIKKSYAKHELESKKKFSYMVKGGVSYLREIHLGKKLGKSAVRFVSDLLKIIKSNITSGKKDPKEESSEK